MGQFVQRERENGLLMGDSITAIAFGGYLSVAVGYRTLFLVPSGLTLVTLLIFFTYFHGPRSELARLPVPKPTLSVPSR